VATYSGIGLGSNAPKKNLVDNENNIYVVGRSYGTGDDFITLKYNPSGNLLWEKRYNGIGNGDDGISAAVLDDSNNIYVTGYSQEGAALGGYNWITIKYYSNGDTAWKRSFNWTANSTDEPFAMTIDKSSNIYISGYGRTAQPFDDDFITLKYSSNGDSEWTKVYASKSLNPDRSNSITVDDSSNVYASGYGGTPDNNEIITIKYNSSGVEKWIKRFPTNYADLLRHTISANDKNNNIIVNGYYYFGDHYAFNTLKYNSQGDLLWNRIYKGDGNLNFCHALTTDDSGNVYAAGRSTNTGTGADFVTIKYYSIGDTAWIRKYDGGFNQFDEAYSIAVDDYQNVYVTGMSDSTDGLSDYLTMKYDSDGNINWIKKYNGYFLVDRSFCLSIDNNYNIIISGFAQKNINDAWITSIKYSQFTGVSGNDIDYNFNSVLFQNYPNPFNPATNIKYQLYSTGIVSIKIYDIIGKEIISLINKLQNSGTHEIKFDINNPENRGNLPSGIYFYSLLIDGKIIDTKRMILIK